MKIMKELRDLNREELHSRQRELQKELLKLNVSVSTGVNPANPGKLRLAKKNIARLTMLLSEKQNIHEKQNQEVSRR